MSWLALPVLYWMTASLPLIDGEIAPLNTESPDTDTLPSWRLVLLIGALPTWPYSGGWGYYPSGGLGLILVIVIVLLQVAFDLVTREVSSSAHFGGLLTGFLLGLFLPHDKMASVRGEK